MHTTTIIRAKRRKIELVRPIVQVDRDPSSESVKRAVAGFLAGYRGQTMTSYRVDFAKFIAWLDTAGTFAIANLSGSAHRVNATRLTQCDGAFGDRFRRRPLD